MTYQVSKNIGNFLPIYNKMNIIIYGSHSEDWNQALGPSSSIWENMIGKSRTVSVSNDEIRPGCIVIPLMESHIDNLLRLKNAGMYLGCKSLIPNKYYLETFQNKAIFANYVGELGLSHLSPVIYNLDNVQFPCVLKLPHLNAGNGISIIENRELLKLTINEPPFKNHNYVLQSLVLGKKEYVTHFVCLNGSVLWHSTYEYIFDTEPVIKKPGKHLAITKITLPDLLLCELILFIKAYDSIKTGYTGPCNFNYKIVNGHIVLFEINPRFGGSLMMLQNRNDLKEAISCIIDNTN
jgi:carbamoylphosphate synthase large subunit